MASKFDIETILSEYIPQIKSATERFIPRTITKEFIEDLSGPPSYAYDPETLSEGISKPIWEILDRGGKRWRSTLMFLIAEVFEQPASLIEDYITIAEIVHNGTLVIDDIEDASDMRRGKPCLHKMPEYGTDIAVNAGNAMYYLPLGVLAKHENDLSKDALLKCYQIYSQEMINLHFGQGMDIWWHSGKSKGDPTTDQYLQMCAFKTGTLGFSFNIYLQARLSAKISAVVCGADDAQILAVGKFAETIGVAFQIQDDILNIVESSVAELKGLGEDIHEGKRTLMVIHCFKNASPEQAKRLRDILDSHPDMETQQKEIQEAIQILKSTDSITYAETMAKQIANDAWDTLSKLLKDTDGKKKLGLNFFELERKYAGFI